MEGPFKNYIRDLKVKPGQYHCEFRRKYIEETDKEKKKSLLSEFVYSEKWKERGAAQDYFRCACWWGDDQEVIARFSKSPYVNINELNSLGFTILDEAIKNHDLALLKLLLSLPSSACLNINKVNREGQAPIHLALCVGSNELFSLIVNDKRTDVNLISKQIDNKVHPLSLALLYNMKEKAVMLLKDERTIVPRGFVAEAIKQNFAVDALFENPRIDFNSVLCKFPDLLKGNRYYTEEEKTRVRKMFFSLKDLQVNNKHGYYQETALHSYIEGNCTAQDLDCLLSVEGIDVFICNHHNQTAFGRVLAYHFTRTHLFDVFLKRFPILTDYEKLVGKGAFHSSRLNYYRVALTLMSIPLVPRVQTRSPIRVLPVELIRMIFYCMTKN